MATILICDVCGKHDKTISRNHYYLGTEMGPAGSTDQVSEVFDLCAECEAKILRTYLEKVNSVYKSNLNVALVGLIKDSIKNKTP